MTKKFKWRLQTLHRDFQLFAFGESTDFTDDSAVHQAHIHTGKGNSGRFGNFSLTSRIDLPVHGHERILRTDTSRQTPQTWGWSTENLALYLDRPHTASSPSGFLPSFPPSSVPLLGVLSLPSSYLDWTWSMPDQDALWIQLVQLYALLLMNDRQGILSSSWFCRQQQHEVCADVKKSVFVFVFLWMTDKCSVMIYQIDGQTNCWLTKSFSLIF